MTNCQCGKPSIAQELKMHDLSEQGGIADDGSELCFDCWHTKNDTFLQETKVEPIDILPNYGRITNIILASAGVIRIAAGISAYWTPIVVCFCLCIEVYFILHIPSVLKKMDLGLASDVARSNLFRVAFLLMALKDYKVGVVYAGIEVLIMMIALGYLYFYSPLSPRKK